MEYRILLNFAASHQSGGLKRLSEYARWFSDNGGAAFIIHPSCAFLQERYPGNQYFPVTLNAIDRLLGRAPYLQPICATLGTPDLYYAYGIPIFQRVGMVNWFHLSNLLPIDSRGIPLSISHRLKFQYLGWQIRRFERNADVISAESRSSLAKTPAADPGKRVLSVNGSDDELRLRDLRVDGRDHVAVCVGTVRYKALDDAYRVFQVLQAREPGLKLVIIGRSDWVSKGIRDRRDVILTGQLPRPDVVERLRRARYYISTTHIENSYNAASEGVFLAEESFLSDIGPHRELLDGSPYERINVPGVARSILQVRRDLVDPGALRSWDQVVQDMLTEFRQRRSRVPDVR